MDDSEYERGYAARIVERLLRGNGEELGPDLERELVISDLESDVGIFVAELDFAAGLGLGIPAMIEQVISESRDALGFPEHHSSQVIGRAVFHGCACRRPGAGSA